jgi:hypothetical protein
MSHSLYLFLHLLGLILAAISIGGMVSRRNQGETTSTKQLSMMHGIGVFMLLLGGFGMLARLDIMWPFPNWIWAKLAIWVLVGGFPAYSKKLSGEASLYLALGLLLAAAFFGINKPF